FQRWDDGSWTQRQSLQLQGAEKSKTAISSIVHSPDGSAIFAVNDLDGHLYTLAGDNGRTVSRLSLGDHPFAAKLSRDGKWLYVSNIGAAEVVSVDVTHREEPKVVKRLAVE